ncbi:MAG: phage tail tape measure protein [Muribaculaceae bacterium]|nr:phage tail tape measure protein [Muribaculaceae bacterium]
MQDKIQLTAKNGVTSFEQLAQALPRVTGNAATLGVSIDELMGTFATLTGVEVHTQLAAISCYHMQAVECSHQVGHGHEKAGHNIHQCRFCGQEGALGLEMLVLA